jgi:cytochrome P450
MTADLGLPSGWRILELGAREDYVARWNRIRDAGPVHDAGEGVHLICSWDAVNAALRHPDLTAGSGVAASFGGADSPVAGVVRNWLMSLDGERHRLARGLVARLFTPRAVAALEPAIAGIADRLARAFLAGAAVEPADFAGLVAQPLPSEVVRHLFAIPAEDWARRIAPLFRSAGHAGADAYAVVAGLAPWFQDHIAAVGDRPTGGILDLLRSPDRQGDRLSEAEVVANAVLIVTAGVDTTAGLIANTLLALLEQPAALARLQADAALIPAALEESLRYYPSAPSTTRRAAAAVTIEGCPIPAGSDLFLSLTAANRDPRRFADPDRFDLDRFERGRDAQALLTFGGGAHYCLGAGLARLEARLAFEALFRALGNRTLRLAEAVRWRSDNPSVRAPETLMVRLGDR